MAWLDIDSTEHHSNCGFTVPPFGTAQNMLNGVDMWGHAENHLHFLIIDLGSSVNVAKMRTKNIGNAANDDIEVFVSDDLGDFGTAVMTGIDLTGESASDWTERILTTQKSGRYVKLTMNTDQINNFLGWGADDRKVLDFFTGALPKTWPNIINLVAQNFTTSSASYVPTDGEITLFPWDGAKYSNATAIYFEATVNIVGGGEEDSWSVELFDRTGASQIVEVSAISGSVIRSVDIKALMPSGAATLDVRIKNNGATSVALKSARIIMTQDSDTTDKMTVFIPVGQKFQIGTTTYGSGRDEALTADCEHQFKYIADNWDFIDSAFYHAVLKATATRTASSALDDIAEGGEFGEVSTSNTSPTLLTSSDISGSLVDDTVYTAFLKSSANRSQAFMIHAWLEIVLNPVTKYEFMYDVTAFGKKEASNTGWQTEETEYRLDYFTGDMWYFGLDSVITKHYSVQSQNSATSIIGALYDDGVRDADSEITETGGTPVYEESVPLSFLDGSEIKSGWNVNSLGLFAFGSLWNSGILVTVVLDDGIVSTRRIFVT